MADASVNLDLLKEIILDFQEQPLECGVTRHLPYERVSGKAFVCVGVRRCAPRRSCANA